MQQQRQCGLLDLFDLGAPRCIPLTAVAAHPGQCLGKLTRKLSVLVAAIRGCGFPQPSLPPPEPAPPIAAMAIPALPTIHSSGRTHRYGCQPKRRRWCRRRLLRINQLRFSQSSIGASLQDGRLLTRVEEDLRAGHLGVSELCPLNVVHFRGRWFSRDNRRLYVLQRVLQPEQHVHVRFGHVDDLFLSHFSTEDEGGTIRVRQAKNAGRRPPRPPPPSDLFTVPTGAQSRLGTCQRILCKANLEAWLAANGGGQTICQVLLHCTSGKGGRPPAPSGAQPRLGTCQRILCKVNLAARLAANGCGQTIWQVLLHCMSGEGGRPPRVAWSCHESSAEQPAMPQVPVTGSSNKFWPSGNSAELSNCQISSRGSAPSAPGQANVFSSGGELSSIFA